LARKADASLRGEVSLDHSKFDRGVKDVQRGFMTLDNGLKALGGIFAGYATVNLIKTGVEMGKLGAESLRLKKSFNDLAASHSANSETILASLKRASSGAVSEANLILSANRAMLLGLGADSEMLGKLMQVASFRGRAMGLDVTQAFSDIVTGIGRKSPLILDNLGIVGLKMGETTTAADLMAQVVKIGMGEIAAAGGVAVDQAAKFEQLGARWDDLKVKFAETLIDPALAVVNIAVTGLDAVESAVDFLTAAQAIESPMYKELVMQVSYVDADGKRVTGEQLLAEVKSPELMEYEAMFGTGATQQANQDMAEMEQRIARINNALLATQAIIPLPVTFVVDANTAEDITKSAMLQLGRVNQALVAEQSRAIALSQAKWAQYAETVGGANTLLRWAAERSAEAVQQTLALGAAKAKEIEASRAANAASAAVVDAVLREGAAYVTTKQALDAYINSVYAAANAQQMFSHGDVSSGKMRVAAAQTRATQLGRQFNANVQAQIDANAKAADDFAAKMQGANNIIASDVATKVSDALGLGGGGVFPRGTALGSADAPAEQIRRLADIAALGEGSPWSADLREQTARAAEALLPGEGIGAQILGDEGAYRQFAEKLAVMAADPAIGAGLLQGLENATGDEWINQEALAHQMAIQKGIEDFAASGLQDLKNTLKLPAEIVPAGTVDVTGSATEGEKTGPVGDWQAKGAEIGSQLAVGIATGLVMESGATPLLPLNTDLDIAVAKITTFKELWDNLDDKNLKLIIEMTSGGGDSGTTPTTNPTTTRGAGAGHIGLASGGSFVVPAGYPNDSYLIGTTSHERVTVTPPGRSSGGDIHISISAGVFTGTEADADKLARRLAPKIKSALRRAGSYA